MVMAGVGPIQATLAPMLGISAIRRVWVPRMAAPCSTSPAP